MRWPSVMVVLVACNEERFKMPSSSMLPTIAIDQSITVTKGKAVDRGDIIVFAIPCETDRVYLKRAIALGGDTIEIRCGVVHVNGVQLATTLVKASDTYADVDPMEAGKKFMREASRWRETLGKHTYEIFDDVKRPEAGGQGGSPTASFPRDHRVPSCASQTPGGGAIPEERLGKIVVTKPEASACEPQAHFVVPADAIFVLGDSRHNSNDSRYWGVVPVNNVVGRMK